MRKKGWVIFIIAVLLINMIFFALGKISGIIFWGIIAIGALCAYFVKRV